MTTDAKQVTVYKLAQAFTIRGAGTWQYTWDYTIHYVPDKEPSVICIGEGCPRESYSANLTPAEALLPQWREKFVLAQGEWLIPLLEALPPGQNPAFADVMAAYRRVHGDLPPTEIWNV